MLRTKSKEDIGRHAEDLLRKAKNETERKSRCFYIAQLFIEVKEFEKVVSYVKEYLSIKRNSSSAYKLLGQAYEGLDQNENALLAYENCLKYDETQHELLLKICQLYCEPKINFDRVRAKHVLDLTQKYFPFHSIVVNLRERLMGDNNSVDKDEYEKLLTVEIKKRPDDCKLRISMLKLYLESGRVELAYRSVNELEKSRMFTNQSDWYESCDKVFRSYHNTCESKCDTDFYTNWLHCLDNLCSLSYSVDSSSPSKDCSGIVLKLDRLLNECWDKSNSDEYKQVMDHFSAQLSFHIAVLLIMQAKEKADYSSELQKEQIWFEHKTKIGALLLLSVKDGVIKSSPVYLSKDDKTNSLRRRVDQSKARYVQVYFTLHSLARNSNQGEKQFVECVNYFVSGNWKKEIYKVFESVPGLDLTKSHFLNSRYFKEVPQKLPSDNEIHSYYQGFERSCGGGLHHMIWLGLRTLTNPEQPLSTKLDRNLRLSVFKSLNLTTGNLMNSNLESLNQLDMDSFLYLTVLCKVLHVRKATDQPVILPSCISSRLFTDKENRFWNNALSMAQDLNREKEAKWSKNLKSSKLSESDRYDMKLVLEQVRAHNLQLPLIVHLARTFTRRAEAEPPVVRDACEKRALHLWDTVLLNLKTNDKKTLSSNIKNPFFNYDVSHFSQTEAKSIGDEARMFIGTLNFKSGYYDKALDNLKSVQTPDSLYKQAAVYEAMSLKDSDDTAEDTRAKRTLNSDRARDCLTRAMDLINSQRDRNQDLTQQITEKLQAWNDQLHENNYTCDGSRNGSDIEESPHLTTGMFNNEVSHDHGLLSSTPRRHRGSDVNTFQHHDDTVRRSNLRGASGSDIADLLTPYRNQLKLQSLHESLKLLTERLENYHSTSNNRLDGLVERLDRRFERLELSLKSYFADLKKEVKLKPDLYNLLEDEDYTPDADIPNYSGNYFQRNAGLMQPPNYVPPVAAPPLSAAAAAYFNPSQLYPAGVPFYGQTVPFSEPQMAEYLRTLAANQRTTALAATIPIPPLHQPTMVPTPNLSHVQVQSTSSPASANKQPVQPQAPNNVVITTSDLLPTTVPTTAPTLFVNIPPEHRLGSTPVTSTAPSAPHRFQIPMPVNFKSVDRAPVGDPSEDQDIEADVSRDDVTVVEHDPMPNFKPVVPLPDEVEVKTGEEDEMVVFDRRAKLFRFVDKEWKERGLGQFKLLKSADEKPRYRIIMRRDQTHKVCANHLVTSDMKLVKATGNEKSYIWWAHDFADEKVQVENFLVRFKTVEDGELFKEKFEVARKAAEECGDIKPGEVPKASVLTPPKLVVGSEEPAKDKITLGGFTFSSQPKITQVSKDRSQEVKKEEKKTSSPFASFNFDSSRKPVVTPPQFGFGVSSITETKPAQKPLETSCEGSSQLLELLKPSTFGWVCDACYIRNTQGSRVCVACENPCPGQVPDSFEELATPSEKPVSTASQKPISTAPQKPVSTVSQKPVSTAPQKPVSTAPQKPVTTAPQKPVTTAPQKPVSAAPQKPVSTAPQKPVSDSKKDSSLPSLSSIFKPAQGSWSCDMCLVQNSANVVSCLACGTVKPGCTATEKPADSFPTFSFGIPSAETKKEGTTVQPPLSKPTQTFFGQNSTETPKTQGGFGLAPPSTGSIFTFGMPSEQSAPSFTFGSAKFNFTMATPTKADSTKSPQVTPKSAHKSDADDSENDHEEDHDHTEGIYFQPVVDLPDKIEVKTGEEDEAVLYSQRAKLFRFDTEAKEWKERGVGDVKILKHKTTGKMRLLMRREPVMKLCLNHLISPDLEVKEKDSKSWLWCAPDFSEGEQVLEKFSIRFKTPDIAQEFKRNLDNAKTGSSGSDDSDDVLFVSQTPIVSEELRNKALALKLPENFYKYLDLPNCPGCRGCEKDSGDQVVKITMPKSETPQKTSLFGQNTGLTQPSFFGSKTSFGAATREIDIPATTNFTGGILTGTSIFGGGPIKTSELSLTPTTTSDQADKVSTFIVAPETTQSQLSTFSFAIGQPDKSTTTPVFSSPPQNSIFGRPSSVFSQSSSIFGGQMSPSPLFGQNSLSESNEGKTSIFGGSQPSFFGGYPASSLFGANDLSKSATPIFGSVKPDLNASALPVFGSQNDQNQAATPVVSSKTEPNISATPAFGAVNWIPVTTSEPVANELKKDILPALLNKDDGLSFETLAAKADPKNAFAGDNSNFKWEGAGTRLFGANSTTVEVKPRHAKEEEEETDKTEGQENDEHDPYFEPVVPLPDKIELKTGEEDEDLIFSERAKLYIMDKISKEWKERGVGQLKVLKHRLHSTYRLLMRREQVFKIVCNHLITPDMNFSAVKSSETTYCWGAMNYTQDDPEPSTELLCAKFKNKDLALQFKKAIDTAQQASSPNSN